jgi:hypothetical protein
MEGGAVGAQEGPVWQRANHGSRARIVAVCFSLLAVGLTALPTSASAATAKPDLAASAVSQPPGGLREGAAFTVVDTTTNTGTLEAGPTATRYYLSQDPKRSLADRQLSKANPRASLTDILLVGSRKVPALPPGKSSKASAIGVVVQVPVGVPAGDYFLLACADDLGAVAESTEAPNCKASTEKQPVSQANPTARTSAFMDTAPNLAPSIEAIVPQILQGLACGHPTPAQGMSLSQAMTSARAYLTKTAGASAMTAFQASPAFDSADAAQQAAGEAAVAGLPGAALAALLRAHDLEPSDASHLINAGGVAASIGLPNQAIAFLDAARVRSAGVRAPMGISRQAVALTSRGYALMQLGRYAEAESALKASIATEPLLTEAQATLAGVEACRGENPLTAFRKGRHRVDPPPKLDDSLGKVTELRTLPIPATAQNLFGEAAFYRGLADDAGNELSAWQTRDAKIRAQLAAQQREQITQRRALDIQQLVAKVQDGGDLVALQSQIDAQRAEAEDEWTQLMLGDNSNPGGKLLDFELAAAAQCEGNPDPNCQTVNVRESCIPATHLAYAGWSNAITSALEKSQEWQRIYSRRVSALAAHLKNPLEYEVAMGLVKFHGILLFRELATDTAVWAAVLEEAVDDNGVPLCIQSPDPPGYFPPPRVAPAGPGACPPAVMDVNFVFSLGPVTLKANCEEFSAEGSGPGWLSGFGEVHYNVREGTMTVFAGAKGEVGLGPVKGDFKSGVYVKVGNDGFRDAGWRVGPSFTVGAGPAEFNPSGTTDMSFVGAFGSTSL